MAMAMFSARVCCRLARSVPLVRSSKDSFLTEITNARFLFSNEVIKVTDYARTRDVVAEKFYGIEEKFRNQLQFYVSDEKRNMIFTEDLKNFIHIMQKTPSDITLCLQMIERFNQQNKEMRFGNYQFGPVVMRAFHHLGLHDEAFKLVTDPAYETFFDRLSAYIIAMDLLYENGLYDKVLKVSEIVADRQFHGCKYPKDSILLISAACYKQNTKESYSYLLNIVQEARKLGSMITGRSLNFMAALALKQNNPNHALEFLSSTYSIQQHVPRNLKMIALAQIDRLEEAVNIIKRELLVDTPRISKPQFVFEETISALQELVIKNGNKERIHEFRQVEKAVRENDAVRKDTLDEMICNPVLPKQQARSTLQQYSRATQQFVEQQNPRFVRTGLTDMEE